MLLISEMKKFGRKWHQPDARIGSHGSLYPTRHIFKNNKRTKGFCENSRNQLRCSCTFRLAWRQPHGNLERTVRILSTLCSQSPSHPTLCNAIGRKYLNLNLKTSNFKKTTSNVLAFRAAAQGLVSVLPISKYWQKLGTKLSFSQER